jgi:hypothetical protein
MYAIMRHKLPDFFHVDQVMLDRGYGENSIFEMHLGKWSFNPGCADDAAKERFLADCHFLSLTSTKDFLMDISADAVAVSFAGDYYTNGEKTNSIFVCFSSLAKLFSAQEIVFLMEGSGVAIGAIESIFWEGGSYDEILDYLKGFCGSPLGRLDEMFRIVKIKDLHLEYQKLPADGRDRMMKWKEKGLSGAVFGELQVSYVEGYYIYMVG